MFAKLKDNQIEKYPYTLTDLQREYPNTSFPVDMDDDLLKSYSIVKVYASPVPTITYRNTVVESLPVMIDNKWMQSWSVVDKSADEIIDIAKQLRAAAYQSESDPIFFKMQRNEAVLEDWINKIAEIKARFPEGV